MTQPVAPVFTGTPGALFWNGTPIIPTPLPSGRSADFMRLPDSTFRARLATAADTVNSAPAVAVDPNAGIPTVGVNPAPFAAPVASGNLNGRNRGGLDENLANRPAPLEIEDMTLDSRCNICFAQISDVVFLPCRHMICCNWCAVAMGANIPNSARCPVCRAMVDSAVRAFRV